MNSVTRPLAAGIILFTGEISAIVEYHHPLLFLPSLATIFLLPSSCYHLLPTTSYNLLHTIFFYHPLVTIFSESSSLHTSSIASDLLNLASQHINLHQPQSASAASDVGPAESGSVNHPTSSCPLHSTSPSYLVPSFAMH